MLQCRDCELYEEGADGQMHFQCNPFKNVREPECIMKWQLLQTESLVRMYQTTLEQYKKFAPLQEKMFKAMEREVREIEEAEKWKWADDKEQQEEERAGEHDGEERDDLGPLEQI